jgi:NitT/TauT family transport system ATP-binding protein
LSLEIIGLSKTFTAENKDASVNVLQDINYKVKGGRFISIIGPSGCGKTTLLRIIAGLEKASGGKILLDGEELVNPVEHMGFVFQEYALFSWRTTLKNIEFGLEVKGIGRKERRSAALEYVKVFGLSGFENKYPRELSGGMQQRVAIARTLINNPEVVLMDEPFGSLDSQTRNSLQEFLLKIWKERRETILFVTHNVDEAVFLSDHIIALTKRPARIAKVFDVECLRPRDRTGTECNEIRKEILDLLANQSDL